MTETASSNFDPRVWAEAAAMLAKNPAFYIFVGLIALFIIAKWPPWRDRKRED